MNATWVPSISPSATGAEGGPWGVSTATSSTSSRQLRERLRELLRDVLGQQRHDRSRALDRVLRLLEVALVLVSLEAQPPGGQAQQGHGGLHHHVGRRQALDLLLERLAQLVLGRLARVPVVGLVTHVVTPSAA
jgi:hypothetical protein